MKLGWCFPLLFPLRLLADEPVLFIPLAPSAPLAHLVALARRPAISSARTGYDDVRCEALRLLGERPKGTPLREKAIKDALLAALSAEQPQIRNSGAAALGRRGYRSELGRFFAGVEADPEPLVHFYRALDSPQKNPPVEMLRKGLHSASAPARAACAEIVGVCHIKALTGELKQLIESDTDPGVRDQAAIALALLGARDSRAALLRLRQRGYQSLSLVRAMIELGGDEQVQGLIPLLWDRDGEIRRLVAEGLGKMPLKDRKTATLSLLATLRDSSPAVRIASAEALASFGEAQAIPILRETLPEARNYSVEERTALVNAVAAFGEELSIPLLNDMLEWRFREECGLEEVLAKYGHPSSGVAAWRAYVDDLEKAKTRRYLVGEYTSALQIIGACADADLLKSVRETAAAAADAQLKGRLEQVVDTIAKRVAQGVVKHRPLLQSPGPVPVRDTDNDGVPDLRDQYPDDPRRVEDIPILKIKFPEKRYAAIPLRTFAHGAPEAQLITLDDDNRVGYLVAETRNEAAAYRVVSTDGLSTTREWILPNPGALAGIEKLVPTSMNARGTVVGMAMWKTEGGDRANDNRLPPGCGFVFKDGKLKLNAEAPFSAATLRSTYKKINQRGDIFGHREERISEGAGADIRTVSFLGDHVFRDVPPFEVTTITETGCLLGYREAADGRESFIWDRSQFIAIDRLHGLRVPLKAVGMNAKLQVIGSFDQANRRGAGPGFLWENGRLRPLSGLIPSKYLFMQSIEPHTINAAGSITFTAELSMTQRKPAQPENFELTIREGDENLLERLRFD